MRLPLTLLLVLSLALAGLAQTPEEALRVGDYPRAEGLLKQALQARPGDKHLRRLMASCQLGLGRTSIALAQAEALGPDDLAVEMVAVTAAYLDARPRRVDYHLERLARLLPTARGAYADYARFLLLSFRFDLDLNRNPSMPASEIVRRHREAWSLLEKIDDPAPFTCELFWITDIYSHAWLAAIQQTKREAAGAILKEAGLLGDPGLVTRMGERLPGCPSASLTALGMFLALGNLAQSSGDLGLSEQLATGVRKAIVPLYEQQKLDGYLSGLLSSLAMLDFWQTYATAQGHPDAARMEELGQQVTRFANQSGNLETELNAATARADYLIAARPAGWSEKATRVLEDAFARPGFASVRRNQIWGYYYLGQLHSGARAVADYQKAIAALEAYITDMGGGSADQIRAAFASHYEKLAQEQLRQGENPGAFETLGRWDQVQSSQAFSLDDLKGRVAPADRKLVERAQEARDELSTRQNELAALQSSQASAEEVARASRVLADTRETYYACITELEKKDPAFERLDIKPVNFSKLQRVIPPDTLVLQMFCSEQKLYLMEVTREKLTVREVQVSRAELDALVQEVRTMIVRFSRHPLAFDWSSAEAAPLKKSLARLRQILIEPAAADMAGKPVLAIIPYGSLMYLPFQTLCTLQPDGSPRFLVEDKQVVVLCKATDLDQVYGPPSSKTGKLVAFGNPDQTLPGATQEVRALQALFPDARVYLEGEATTDRMSGVQAPDVSYLHLATHGNLNAQDSRSSYLTMARGQQLTVSEITSRRLDTGGDDLNLVTLSACQTALGEKDATGSDLRTLADAFSLAGCRSMVASLWKVSDGSTRDFMVLFYQGLKAGKPKALALQEAEIQILRDPRYAHPYYWAPFILIGDWR